MFFLSKLLPVFVLPIGAVILVVLLCTWKKWRGLVLAALGLFYLSCTPAVGTWLIAHLERTYPPLKIAEAGPADVVLVLGGVIGPRVAEGYLPNWSDSVERFEGGVALVAAERAPRLLFTGARMPWQGPGETEGEVLRRAAMARGIPGAIIDVTSLVTNTADEAGAAAAYCRERNLHSLLLVTSAAHMPRAMQLFRRTGLVVIPFPVDYHADAQRRLALVDFLPNSGGLGNTESALRECYGYVFNAVTRR